MSQDQSQLEMPSEYWQIQKLLKFLSIGNQSATILSLCALNSFDFSQNCIKLLLSESNCVEVLLNIVDNDHDACKTAALRVLSKISDFPVFKKLMIECNAINTLAKILDQKDVSIKYFFYEYAGQSCKLNLALEIEDWFLHIVSKKNKTIFFKNR